MSLAPNDIVILSRARTPVGDFLGALKDVSLVDLTAAAGQAALERAGVSPEEIDEVAMGCLYKHGNKGNPARQVQIKLGCPSSGWAYTVDQQCASAMKAFDCAYYTPIHIRPICIFFDKLSRRFTPAAIFIPSQMPPFCSRYIILLPAFVAVC